MRMQPDEIAWPIYSGWLVPWILYTLLAAINEDWTNPDGHRRTRARAGSAMVQRLRHCDKEKGLAVKLITAL
jgi:hypothetical protein